MGSIDEAIRLLSGDEPDDVGGKFIQRRDIAMLEAAKDLLRDLK